MSGGLIPEPDQRTVAEEHVAACLHGALMAVFHARDDLVRATDEGPWVNVKGIAEEAARIVFSLHDYVVVRAEGLAHGDTLHQTLRPGLATLWRRVKYPKGQP